MLDLDLDTDFFIVDNIEELTFHMAYPTMEIKEKFGMWFEFFDYMFAQSKSEDGPNWKLEIKTIIINKHKLVGDIRKYSKELIITIGDDIIKMGLKPHFYINKNKMYSDMRFNISSKRPEAILLLYLFKDNILKR